MLSGGILLVIFSGVGNGLFSAPMRLEKAWRWENTWIAFILVACVGMPAAMIGYSAPGWRSVLSASPGNALAAALSFGFLWGFGAICFGLSVARLGVSIANSLIIGLSSAFGSLVPLITSGGLRVNHQQVLLLSGVLVFLIGVLLCGRAGRLREAKREATTRQPVTGYLFAFVSGMMSAIFNVGYGLALPIADSGVRMGYSRFGSTNCIWLLMLGMGAIPNVAYCLFLMHRNGTGSLLFSSPFSWLRSISMGLLWGGSIYLYGAATPLLGSIGPSIGWPLSLAVGLVVANLMGLWLGEWRNASRAAVRSMNAGIATLLAAIILCAAATRASA